MPEGIYTAPGYDKDEFNQENDEPNEDTVAADEIEPIEVPQNNEQTADVHPPNAPPDEHDNHPLAPEPNDYQDTDSDTNEDDATYNEFGLPKGYNWATDVELMDDKPKRCTPTYKISDHFYVYYMAPPWWRLTNRTQRPWRK
eukprot:8434532-Ditylum_brightwellii.AAC.1